MRFEIKHLIYAFALIGSSLGLFGPFGLFVAGVVGAIWIMIFRDWREEAEKQRATRKAVSRKDSGFTLVELLAVIFIVGMLVALLLPAVNSARSFRNPLYTTRHQMISIAVALHNYHDRHGVLPPVVTADVNGDPAHSWRASVLPYVEQPAVTGKYRMDEAWDGPNNRKLAPNMPWDFQATRTADEPVTHFNLVVGPGAVWEKASDLPKLSDMERLDLTIMLIESEDPVPWLQPTQMSFREAKRLLTSEPGPKSRWWQQGFFKSHWKGRPVMTMDGSFHVCGVLDEATADALLSARHHVPPKETISELPYRLGEPREAFHYHNVGRLVVFLGVAFWPTFWLREEWRKFRKEEELENSQKRASG